MKNKFNVAVVGATGAVGEMMMEILLQRNFPIDNIYALASSRSAGQSVDFGDTELTVEDLDLFDFSNVDFALFSAGGSVSAKYAPRAAEQGAIVIDNTSEFRYNDDIPLIVPEVNFSDLGKYDSKIIANPNCSTIQMLVALAPIHKKFKIKNINISTYQSVSGAGKKAIEDLATQSKKLLNGMELEEEDLQINPIRIAFNALPKIDCWQDNGFTKEEMKMSWETNKILDKNIKVNATCVRIPVFFGHSESIHIETEKEISVDGVFEVLQDARGICLAKGEEFPTVEDAAGEDGVYVGRVRESLINKTHGINLWVVSDNIRKGAALNSVQIAEEIVLNRLV
jgi:aspartate-semialdehyde dehydrogenase